MKAPFLENGSTGFTLPDGSWQCTGSQMGRRDAIPDDYATVRKLHLVRVPMVGGDYDPGGAYWGGGIGVSPLYCAYGESDTEQVHAFFRATSRADAKARAVSAFPNASFYR